MSTSVLSAVTPGPTASFSCSLTGGTEKANPDCERPDRPEPISTASHFLPAAVDAGCTGLRQRFDMAPTLLLFPPTSASS